MSEGGRVGVEARRYNWAELLFGRIAPGLFFAIFVTYKVITVQAAIADLELPGGAGHWGFWLHLVGELMGLVYFSLIAIIYATRLPSLHSDLRWQTIVVSMFATFGLNALPFLPHHSQPDFVWAVGSVLGPLGLGYSIWSLVYLRRSFSIVPEARRLVSGGPYAISRHPLYLGEAMAGLGSYMGVIAWPGVILIALWLLAQYKRMKWEEKILTRDFPEYEQYAHNVPRLFPDPLRSESFRSRLGARGLMLGGMMIAIWIGFISRVEDPDFWWHVRTGQWIFDNRRLPVHDLYTFTVQGHLWDDHEWLSELLLFGLWRLGGAVAVTVVIGALTWLGFVFIWKRAEIHRRPAVIAGLGIALAAAAGAPIWGPRIQMEEFLFTCITLWLLHDFTRRPTRRIWWLAPMVLVWANLHGSFIFAFLLIGIAGVADFLRQSGGDMAARARLKTLILVTGACLVAGALTPHGPVMYLYAIQTQTSPAQQSLIVEWFSPDFHSASLRAFELMVFLTIVGFTLRRPSLDELLFTLFTLFMALESVRHVALFVAAATPALISVYSDFFGEHGGRLRQWGSKTVPPKAVAALTLVLLTGLSMFIGLKLGSDLSTQDKDTAGQYPVGASAWLAAHPESCTRTYNQYGWGGYLIYRFYPDPNRRVFIFGEAALMGDQQLRDYQQVAALGPRWQTVLDNNRIDCVLYGTNGSLANVLKAEPDQWVRVYHDPVAEIYERKSGALLAASPS